MLQVGTFALVSVVQPVHLITQSVQDTKNIISIDPVPYVHRGHDIMGFELYAGFMGWMLLVISFEVSTGDVISLIILFIVHSLLLFHFNLFIFYANIV